MKIYTCTWERKNSNNDDDNDNNEGDYDGDKNSQLDDGRNVFL